MKSGDMLDYSEIEETPEESLEQIRARVFREMNKKVRRETAWALFTILATCVALWLVIALLTIDYVVGR